jgi:hypothetical protein
MTLAEGSVLLAAAVAAGAINSVAGGGTLVTFPALFWALQDAKLANATSTVALWPGSLGGACGYRRELKRGQRWMFLLGVPSVLGGAAGALLLIWTPTSIFEAVVPYLILFATLLFMAQGPISRYVLTHESATPSKAWLGAGIVLQALIALYGGYFGAGIGILMLAALGLLGLRDIHQMNGLKTLLAMCINGLATGCFVFSGLVQWPEALLMTGGSVAGGYAGAKFARGLGQRTVRAIVIAIGLLIAGRMLYQQLA